MKTIQKINAILIFLSLLTVHQSQAQCHIDDWTALKAIYDNSNIQDLSWADGWVGTFLATDSPWPNCNLNTLAGVQTNNNGRVTELKIIDEIPADAFLPLVTVFSGTLTAEIGLLIELEVLFLPNLTGDIPETIQNLTKLKELQLSAREASPGFIEFIEDFTQLTWLDLATTPINGNFPAFISNLNNLTHLNLFRCNLTGNIPESIGNLTNLISLNLSSNELSGNIPDSMGNLTQLKVLNLGGNFDLTGVMPTSLGNLLVLESLLLYDMSLTGNLPGELGNLQQLKEIDISTSTLTGCFDANLANLCGISFRDRSFTNSFDATWEDFCASAMGICDTGENPSFGCRDPNACNYDIEATYTNNSICAYPIINCDCNNINGCTDANAMNYNPNADCNDGSCEYENTLAPGEYYISSSLRNFRTSLENTCNTASFEVIENTTSSEVAINNLSLSVGVENNSGIIKISTQDVSGCEAIWTFNFSPNNCDDSFIFNFTWLSRIVDQNNCAGFQFDTYRRRIKSDIAYPPEWIYVRYGNTGALYDFNGNSVCSDYVNDTITNCLANLEKDSGFWSCTSRGCTDPSANNYNPNAECNNGSCIYDDIENPDNTNCHINDWTALKVLYESTGGDNWTNNTGWEEVKGDTPSNTCDLDLLHGVTPDETGRVTKLKLFSKQLNGSIPPEIGNLTNLTELELAGNQLSGSIPPEIGNLTKLTKLGFTDNQLNGSIPPEIGNLSNLTFLNLIDNQLSGSIPPEVGNLSNLTDLLLANNQFSGSIPAEIGNLNNLFFMDLSKNLLSGNIPAELGNLNNLAHLGLSSNQLTGRLPAELGNISSLASLITRDNNLGGCFPSNLMSLCPQLRILSDDPSINSGNNFDATWFDFCINGDGVCTNICPEGDPLQWQWVQMLLALPPGVNCEYKEIRQFEYNGNFYLEIIPGATIEGLICSSGINTTYYSCTSEYICGNAETACEPEILAAASNATTIWMNESLPPTTCLEGDPLQWGWIQDIINSDSRCIAAEIREFEYNGNTYIETVVAGDEFGFPCQADNGNSYYTCTGEFICHLGLPNPNRTCDPGLLAAADNYTTLWTYQNVEEPSPSPIFQDYPWLSTYINQSNCNGENITVYDAGSYNFILIQNGNEGKLYYQNGTYYCDETPTYSCVDAYNLTNVAQTWSCGNNPPNPTPTINGCTDSGAINYNPNANEDDGSCQYEQANSTLFETYPWLSAYVNQSNCSGESITVYDAGSYNFILIQNGNEGKLYFENGTFYCNETPTYSCVAAYSLSNITQTWSCGNNTAPINGCTDSNAINYNPSATVNDGSCEYENPGNCNAFTGTFFYQDCGGINYYFIRLTDGRIFDPYFADGIGITPIEGQQIRFDYEIKTDVTTPCSISESPITITCFEDITVRGCTDSNAINYNPSATVNDGSCEYENMSNCNTYAGTFFYEDCGGINYYFIRLTDGRVFDPYFAEGIGITPIEGQQIHFDYEIKTDVTTPCNISESPITITCFEAVESSILDEYLWLNTLIDTNNCGNTSVSLFSGGSYYFVYVQSASGNRLYYQDGTFYCEDGPGYSCLSLYNLTNTASVWNCGGGISTKKQSTNISNLILKEDFKIYPNPTTGKVFINLLDANNYQIKLMDISGKVMEQLETKMDESIIEMNVNNLPKGIYLVVLKNELNSSIQKLIIK